MRISSRRSITNKIAPDEPGAVLCPCTLRPNHWTLDETTDYPYIVQNEDFEWDDAKAARNWANHGVSFEMARDGFRDAFAVEWIDDRQQAGEERIAMIAAVESRILFVAYTMRGERIRIISARKAEPHERRRYHDENQA